MSPSFRCGHPREGNTIRGRVCAMCDRIRTICRLHRRDQHKLNQGKPLGTFGQRIASGNVWAGTSPAHAALLKGIGMIRCCHH